LKNIKSGIRIIFTFIVLALILSSTFVKHISFASEDDASLFLFAKKYSIDDVMRDPKKAEAFTREYLKWESEFFKMARHRKTGITFDGYNLDSRMGLPSKLRFWSAPSKECLDIAICIKAIEGNPYASIVVSRDNPKQAPSAALKILKKKIKSYGDFHKRNPGYAGFLPWFYSRDPMVPVVDWVGEIPGLDNGEWAWSLLIAEDVLRKKGHGKLADEYKAYNEMLRKNAVRVFYDPKASKVRGDVRVVDPSSSNSKYLTISGKPGRCEYLTGEHGINEGTMLILYVTLFGEDLPAGASKKIWDGIRMKRIEHKYGTTWQGEWGSAHESWIFLFVPLRDIPQFRDLFRIREKIRSQNAAQRKYPGFATSTHKPGEDGYIDGAGIEGAGSQKIRNNHTYAVYGAFPILMEFSDRDKAGNYGLAWLLNMLKAEKMQGPLGGGESATNDGRLVSYVKTIDGSFTNVIALCGGLEKESADMLRHYGLYKRFIKIIKNEYDEAFGEKPLREPVGFAIPANQVPTGFKKEYSYIGGDKGKLNGQDIIFSGEQYLRQFDFSKMNFLYDERYKRGLSLDGKWEVIAYYDGNNKKVKDFKKGHRNVNFPGHWIYQGYFDTTGLELMKKFRMGAKKHGKREKLHFGGSIYYTSVKLNGKTLKTIDGDKIHEGYFMPFEYDITDFLKYGEENIIEVTVRNPNEKPDNDLNTKNGGTGFPQWGANKRDVMGVLDFHDTKPGTASHQKFNVGGIWKPIRIFSVDKRAGISGEPMINTTLVKRNNLTESDFDRRDAQVNFNIPIRNMSGKEQGILVRIKIRPENFIPPISDIKTEKEPGVHSIKYKLKLKPGKHNIEIACLIRKAKLWWPWNMGKPNLYGADIEIYGGDKLIDQRKMRFGVREMTGDMRGGWYLNGRLIRILGDNIIPSLTPGTYAKKDAIRDGKLVVEANLQLVRVHAHVPHPYFWEMTDQMGILVWQDFPQQWLSRWDDEYRNAVFRQLKPFAGQTVSHPSIILLNVHNENKYFDANNAYGLPRLHRGIWMHASKIAEKDDHRGVTVINKFFRKSFKKALAVKPNVGMFISPETGAEYHPYYGYYYGEGLFDYYFLATPSAKGVFPKYNTFSPSWGWREEAHSDPGVGAVPTSSYERCSGGGGYNQFGPDEFGFQGLSKSAIILALKDVLREKNPDLNREELQKLIKSRIKLIPWGYFYAPRKIWEKSSRTENEELFFKVFQKLEEHCFQAGMLPQWLMPEKPIKDITLDEMVEAHQNYQAWGTQVTLEIYRRAGYGQTRFLFVGSEDDHEMLYSVDWSVLESNRKPKKAFYSVKLAYQPVLASSEILSQKVLPGETLLNGLTLNNDTFHRLKDLSIVIVLDDDCGNILKQRIIRNIDMDPYQIRNLDSMLKGRFPVSNRETPPGKYLLTLRVLDSKWREISRNLYEMEVIPDRLLAGLKEDTREKARKILKVRLSQLEKHFKNSLKIDISDRDAWAQIIGKLGKSRRKNWNEWKKEFEKNPEVLLDFPEFTTTVQNLLNARLKMDSAKQNPAKAESEYKRVLEYTRQNLELDETNFKILMGERGARIPIPLFYGKQITTDEWFRDLLDDLREAGAESTRQKIMLYRNTKSGHWFDRQVKIYRALRRSVNAAGR